MKRYRLIESDPDPETSNDDHGWRAGDGFDTESEVFAALDARLTAAEKFYLREYEVVDTEPEPPRIAITVDASYGDEWWWRRNGGPSGKFHRAARPWLDPNAQPEVPPPFVPPKSELRYVTFTKRDWYSRD